MPTLPFTIGSDPEFTFVSAGRRFNAREVFQKLMVPARETAIKGYRDSAHGDYGWDGADATAEIRPLPSNDPEIATRHIGALLKNCYDLLPTAELKTVSLWASIGGHIHFDIERYTHLSETQKRAVNRGLASFALPLVCGENPLNGKIRKAGGYGQMMDFRSGDHGTYEFRPLTAEWITTPETCHATLAYLGVVWNELVHHPERVNDFMDIIAKDDAQAIALQELAFDEYGLFTKAINEAIAKHVKSMELYPAFKKQCDLALNPGAMRALKEAVNWDAAKGWKFSGPKTHLPKKTDLTNTKKTLKAIEGLDLSKVMNYTQIFWTNDRNMESFARKVGDSAIAWKWSLENRYYLFALPKGIPSPIVFNGRDEVFQGSELVKTTGDLEKFRNITETAKTSLSGHYGYRTKTLDLKTGNTVYDDDKSLVIGVPEMMAIAGDTKQILTIMHDLEAGKAKKEVMEYSKDSQLLDRDPVHGDGLLLSFLLTGAPVSAQIAIGLSSHGTSSSSSDVINARTTATDSEVSQHVAEEEALLETIFAA